MFAATNHRAVYSLVAVNEINRVATERAEEIMVDAARRAPAPVAGHRADQLLAARPGQDRTSVRAEVAYRRRLLQIPGSRDVFVRRVQQSPGRTNVDAVAAVGAFDPAAERTDQSGRAAIDRGDREFVHPFFADARAAFADYAALRVVVNEGRDLALEEILLVAVLRARAVFAEAVGLILQFALARPVADRAIHRMVREQEFDHRRARLFNLFRLGGHNHPVADRRRACGLELWNLRIVHAHHAHPARSLRRQPAMMTEARQINAVHLARLDQQLAFRRGHFLSVNC